MPAIGLVEADIANGASGQVVILGGLQNLDTTVTESWTAGDALYVNDSGTSADTDCGNTLTNVRPANTDDNIQKIGSVIRVNPALGQLNVSGANRSNDVPNLEDAKIWVGNGSNVATAVDMSADCTLANTGAITCDHDALDNFASNEHYLQSAITEVGTIATGVWNGTAILDAYIADDITLSTNQVVVIDVTNAEALLVRKNVDGGDVFVVNTSADTVTTTGTVLATVGFDCVGNVDCDYGSVDIDDHTFITDGTGTSEIVLPAGSIDGTEILDDTIDSADYAATSIDLEHMSVNSIDSDQYVDGSIDLIHMSVNSIDSNQYVDGSIDLAHMSSQSVDSDNIVDNTIANADMADNSIDSDDYVDGSIDLIHMSANSIDSNQYVDGSIDLAHMSANSVDSDQYVDGSIDLIHMSVNSVDSDQYVDASIDNAHLADNAVDSAELASGSVDDVHHAADTITHASIADADQTITECIWIEYPVATDDLKSIWANKTANNFLITEIWGESDNTVNFDLQIDDGTPADVNGTDISPASGEAEDTTLSGDTTLAAGEELDLAITSVSGVPTWVSICWTGNWVD
jgi:hypothetical protein